MTALSGVVICGIVFMLMGGLPLLIMLPATIRGFTREQKPPRGWPVGMPLAQMQRVAARVQPSTATRWGMADETLERLAKLHERGVAHRRRVRGAGEGEAPLSAGLRFYWFVVQAAAVAGGHLRRLVALQLGDLTELGGEGLRELGAASCKRHSSTEDLRPSRCLPQCGSGMTQFPTPP